MGLADKSLQCSSCGSTFIFSAEEQGLFAAKGYTNEPKRCHHAAKQGKRNVMAMVATNLGARYIPQCVPSAAKKRRCPLSLAKAGQYIAVLATTRSD